MDWDFILQIILGVVIGAVLLWVAFASITFAVFWILAPREDKNKDDNRLDA